MRRWPPELSSVGVNDLPQARAVVAWAAAGRHPRPRLYGLDAPLMGVGFWFEVERRLDRPLVVECHGHVGTVLAALRMGLKHLMIGDVGAQRDALDRLVAAHGAVVVGEPPSLRLRPGADVERQLARARCERVTRSHTADKDAGEGNIVGSATGHRHATDTEGEGNSLLVRGRERRR